MAGHVSAYALVKAFLTDHGHPNVTREVPANLAFDLPLHVVARFGGGDESVVVDLPRIDIDTFASSEDTAENLGEAIRTLMRTVLPSYVYSGSTVLRARTMTAPRLLPWQAANVFRVGASYELRVHRSAGVFV